jgi:hypothetical protein
LIHDDDDEEEKKKKKKKHLHKKKRFFFFFQECEQRGANNKMNIEMHSNVVKYAIQKN